MSPSEPPGRPRPRLRAVPGEPPSPRRTGGTPPVDGALALSRPARARPELRTVPDDERAPLTESSPWLRTLAQMIAEALAGCRPADPLRTVVAHDVYMTICRSRRTFRAHRYRPQLWRLRTCAIDRDHVEAAVVVRFGDDYRALALRLDRAATGWRCTVLRIA
ncbi:MAG TPA: Rv3235 family protein [Streptosporangiaceae bacterium]